MRLVILGAGGHAAALFEIAEVFWKQRPVLCRLTDEYEIPDDFEQHHDDRYAIGIGTGIDLGIPKDRIRLFETLGREKFASLISPAACMSQSTTYGRGVQIMAGAIVQPRCRIGDNVLINTGAQIDHDCNIGDHTMIGPGAVLCGEVTLGKRCVIGASATIVQRGVLPDETRVPAGTLVCGPDDFRKPVPMVRIDGTDVVEMGAPVVEGS